MKFVTALLMIVVSCVGYPYLAAKAEGNIDHAHIADALAASGDMSKEETDIIKARMSSMTPQELSSFAMTMFLDSTSVPGQCSQLTKAFGEKIYNNQATPRNFTLAVVDLKIFNNSMECIFKDAHYDLVGYTITYIGPKTAFEYVTNKFKSTGAKIVTKEYPTS